MRKNTYLSLLCKKKIADEMTNEPFCKGIKFQFKNHELKKTDRHIWTHIALLDGYVTIKSQ